CARSIGDRRDGVAAGGRRWEARGSGAIRAIRPPLEHITLADNESTYRQNRISPEVAFSRLEQRLIDRAQCVKRGTGRAKQGVARDAVVHKKRKITDRGGSGTIGNVKRIKRHSIHSRAGDIGRATEVECSNERAGSEHIGVAADVRWRSPNNGGRVTVRSESAEQNRCNCESRERFAT